MIYYSLKKDYGIRTADNYGELFQIFNNSTIATLSSTSLWILLKLDGQHSVSEIILALQNRFLSISQIEIMDRVNTVISILQPYLQGSTAKSEICIRPIIKKTDIRHKKMLMPVHIPIPQIITFNLTDICPRNCVYCYAGAHYSKNKDTKNRFLSPDRFDEIVSECKDMGVPNIELSGGDPFKHENILDYIKIVLKYGYNNCILSTKSYISKNIAGEIKKLGLSTIQISLDSADEKIADYLMGVPNSYKEIVESINNLISVGLKVNVNCVLTSYNTGSAYELIPFLDNLGVNELSFNLYGFSCGRHDKKLYPSLESIEMFDEQINQTDMTRYNIKLRIPNLDRNFIRSKFSSNPYTRHAYRSFCGALRNRLNVTSTGRVSCCAFIPVELAEVNDLIFGDLHGQSIREIWENEKIKSFVSIDKEKYKNTECYDCKDFEQCQPKMCVLRSIISQGKPYKKDPMCKYNEMNFM